MLFSRFGSSKNNVSFQWTNLIIITDVYISGSVVRHCHLIVLCYLLLPNKNLWQRYVLIVRKWSLVRCF